MAKVLFAIFPDDAQGRIDRDPDIRWQRVMRRVVRKFGGLMKGCVQIDDTIVRRLMVVVL